MKALLIAVMFLGVTQIAKADIPMPHPVQPQEQRETISHTISGPAAQAKFNRIPGPAISNGPIAMCFSTGEKVERSRSGLVQTLCSESSNRCPVQPTVYSCTTTKALDGKPLPRIPLGIAL